MKAVVILSGGMDSTTLLYKAKSEYTEVYAISFNYGQKHSKELQQAQDITKELKIDHVVINVPEVKDILASALTGNSDIPEGHYAQDNMKQTVVPNRNAIMLSIAYGYAVSIKADHLLYGAHAGDHFVYPDCRPEFAEKLNEAFLIGNEGFGNTEIVAPFINITKSDIVGLGLTLYVPYEKTWSCYKGEERPCLKCGTCTERTEAFLDNDTKDPALTDLEWATAVEYYQKLERTK